MRTPGKGVFLALLVVFAPGIAFALFELFVFQVPVKGRARLMAWAFLAFGLACLAGLLFLVARDALWRLKGRRAGGAVE